LVKPVIFQVVGYQNSGKTTLTSRLIEGLKINGLKTATIKHHGHGGKPAYLSGKDSAKHHASGALASMVEGEGRLILQANLNELDLEDYVELLNFFHPDVILIEGYKFRNYPKLLLLRDQEDLHLIEKVNNVRAAVYWKEEIKESILKANSNLHCYHISDQTVISSTIKWIQQRVHEKDEKN